MHPLLDAFLEWAAGEIEDTEEAARDPRVAGQEAEMAGYVDGLIAAREFLVELYK